MSLRPLVKYGLLALGFAWIAAFCLDLGTASHHALWVWHSQQLGDGATVSRAAAISQLRELALHMHRADRLLLVPACMMLVGGLVDRERRAAQQGAATDKAAR